LKISVIIPALNEEAQIQRCIASARQSGCDELIVADGGSSDRTLELARALDCKVITTDPGRAIQQHAAAMIASGEVLLFLHADNWLADSAGDQIRQALADPRTVGGAFRQRIDSTRVVFRWIERGNGLRVRWFALPYGDQGIFVRREAYFDVGGFSAVRLLEDVLLMKRVRKLGKVCLLAGPIYVSPRGWQKHGVIRQTVRNWAILTAHALGVPPNRLASYYVGHAVHDGSRSE
jgi:rSAM/selenodomain-associated transferase 2